MLSKSAPFYFKDLSGNGRGYPVEDDHKPFLKQSLLHLYLYFKLLFYYFGKQSDK
jgi:hypothetical protein